MKKKKLFVIPAQVDIGRGEMADFEDYPDATAYGDSPMAEILGVKRITVLNWRNKGLIPFTQRRGYAEFNVLEVVNALKAAGYAQDKVDNPLKEQHK